MISNSVLRSHTTLQATMTRDKVLRGYPGQMDKYPDEEIPESIGWLRADGMHHQLNSTWVPKNLDELPRKAARVKI